MTDIFVTMPKSRGGLKHLQEKIDFATGNHLDGEGYAWWWVKAAKELTVHSFVDVVCEGRLRGRFGIKWLVEVVKKDGQEELRVQTHDGVCVIFASPEWGGIKVRQEGDGGCYASFKDKDIQMLWDQIDDWYREGKICIFFDGWYPDLEQPDMKGFQGFKYRR